MKDERQDWLLRRRSGIGGSDIAALLGISPWRTAFDIWQEKTSTGPVIDNPSVKMRIGTELEPLAAKMYEEETGRKTRKCNILLRSGRLIGNVDRLCACEDGSLPWTRKAGVRTNLALEIKTSSSLEEWDTVPRYYESQAQHYMGLMPTVVAFDFPVLFVARGTFRIYRIARNDEAIAAMREVAEKFWRNYVETNTPPPPQDDEDAVKIFPRHEEGKVVVADEELEEIIAKYRKAQDDMKQAKSEADGLKLEIQKAMGSAEAIVTPDKRKLCTWKSGKDRLLTDWEGLSKFLGRMVAPAVLDAAMEQYSHTSPSPRTFRLSSGK